MDHIINNVETCHVRSQVIDQRDLKIIQHKDNLKRANTPSTLREVNEILNKPGLNDQKKIEHGLDWSRISESEYKMHNSLKINKSEDGMTAEYRNPEKRLEPGVRDSSPIYSKTTYQQGVHVFEFDLKFVSPILTNSHINVYIGIGSQCKQQTTKRKLIRKWWLSLTKTMLLLHKPFPELYPDRAMEIPQKVLMVLDMDEGTLGFIVNNNYLGPAHGELCGLKVCPMISYYGNVDCDIKMEYIGYCRNPASLKKICRKCVRELSITKNGMTKQNLCDLNLPDSVEKYVVKDLNSV